MGRGEEGRGVSVCEKTRVQCFSPNRNREGTESGLVREREQENGGTQES